MRFLLKFMDDRMMDDLILESGYKIVYILRGVPGCGKSTWWERNKKSNWVRVSADDEFTAEGRYRFDPAKLQSAHRKCLLNFLKAITESTEIIVVDNTNIEPLHAAPYVSIGEAFGYSVQVVDFNRPVEECIESNQHRVPEDVVRRMWERQKWIRLPQWWKVVRIPE